MVAVTEKSGLRTPNDAEEFFVYESDHNGVDDSPQVAPKRLREGQFFVIVAHHDSLQLAITAMKSYNNHVTTRVKGRNNRGRTASCYWYCSFNT